LDRLDDCGAKKRSCDRPEARRRARRRELQGHRRRVRLSGPSARCRRWPLVRRCVVPSVSRRWTALHHAFGSTDIALRLLVGGADQTIANNDGYAVPPAAKQPHSIGSIGAGKRLAKSQKHAGSATSSTPRCRRCGRRRRAAACARARPSLLHAMIATHALPQHGVPRLRSSAYAEAVAARCASHGARSAAAVGRQRVVREHTALPRSVRGARRGARRAHGAM
jgi:hypothetical protein